MEMRKGKLKKISLRIPDSMYDELKEYADRCFGGNISEAARHNVVTSLMERDYERRQRKLKEQEDGENGR